MNTSFSGSLPLLSTLFVFYYTYFMANKICMYVCIAHCRKELLMADRFPYFSADSPQPDTSQHCWTTDTG